MVLRKGTARVQKWPLWGLGSEYLARGRGYLGEASSGGPLSLISGLLWRRMQRVCPCGNLREPHEQGGTGVGLGLGPGRVQRSQAGGRAWALAAEEGQRSPRLWALTTSVASQELQLLGAGSSVISCLLEGPVRLGPGSVLQHCHLQVTSERRGRARSRSRGARSRVCWGVSVLLTRDACSLPW